MFFCIGFLFVYLPILFAFFFLKTCLSCYCFTVIICLFNLPEFNFICLFTSCSGYFSFSFLKLTTNLLTRFKKLGDDIVLYGKTGLHNTAWRSGLHV